MADSPWANVAAILDKEVSDARRNRWFVLFAAVFAGLSLGLSLLGLAGLGTFGVAGFGRTAASLMNLVILVVPLMGLTLGAVSIAHEREQGTLLTLLAQPVTSVEVLLGKFFGLAAALTAALLFGFGLSSLAVAWQGGTAQLGDFLLLVGLTVLLGWTHLSLGFLLSAATGRSATALSLALFLWLALVFFSDLGLIGTSLVLRLPPATLLGLALANPAQEFKLAAVQALQGNLELLGAAGLYATEVLGARLLPLLMVLLLLWTVVPLGLAAVLFARRGGQ